MPLLQRRDSWPFNKAQEIDKEIKMQLALRDHQSAETMDELRALNARFIHNFVTNDVASHDAILHPRFINIWPTGQRWDRATYLTNAAA